MHLKTTSSIHAYSLFFHKQYPDETKRFEPTQAAVEKMDQPLMQESMKQEPLDLRCLRIYPTDPYPQHFYPEHSEYSRSTHIDVGCRTSNYKTDKSQRSHRSTQERLASSARSPAGKSDKKEEAEDNGYMPLEAAIYEERVHTSHRILEHLRDLFKPDLKPHIKQEAPTKQLLPWPRTASEFAAQAEMLRDLERETQERLRMPEMRLSDYPPPQNEFDWFICGLCNTQFVDGVLLAYHMDHDIPRCAKRPEKYSLW
ncbi:hypothetical protein B0O99DRAFT_598152 [Bisporella sp. PMI_857]|nr:hypothetical protein B0O99DRAFT_598152 [Bisporella sp. PMI_857]